jgi:hypothetical protein
MKHLPPDGGAKTEKAIAAWFAGVAKSISEDSMPGTRDIRRAQNA